MELREISGDSARTTTWHHATRLCTTPEQIWTLKNCVRLDLSHCRRAFCGIALAMVGMLDCFAQGFAKSLEGPIQLVGGARSYHWAPPVGRRASAQALMKPDSLPVSMQVCLPASLWDWPDDPLGSVSAKLYEFVSYVPEHPDNWGAYTATTDRLSDAYSLFLSALPQSVAVQNAQAALALPANQVQVQFPNGPRMMPDWIVTESPSGFVNNVAGKPDLASTIVIDLSGSDDSAGSGQALFSIARSKATSVPIHVGKGGVQQIKLHADAWGNIPVRPGAWFNGALVRLLGGGPYQTGFSRDKFFGNTGILRGMISGLRVGLNVSVVATMSEHAAKKLKDVAATGAIIRVGGLGYDARVLSATETNGIAELRLPASSGLLENGKPISANTPVLVGVDVSELG